MHKYLLLLFPFFLFLAISCKKSQKPAEPPESKISYTVDSQSTQPGLVLTLKASSAIKKDSCTVRLGEKSVWLFKIDSFHYAFWVPVIKPGTYLLDLNNLNAANAPDILIRSYTQISDPDAVIDAINQSYNQIADSLEKNSIFNPQAAQNALYLRQLTLQLVQNMMQCTAEQKLLLAYQSQNMVPDASAFKKNELDTTYIVSRQSGIQKVDISDVIVAATLYFSTKSAKAIALAGVCGISLTAVVIAPPPFDIAAFGTFFLSLRACRAAVKEAQETEGEAFQTVYRGVELLDNNNGESTNPVETSGQVSIWEKYFARDRTVQESDETGPNLPISDAIKAAKKLVIMDQTIETRLATFKSTFANFFDKVTATYSPFTSTILTSAKEKVVEAPNEFISVSNVSNPDITVIASDDGKNGLKLNFSNPSNNIKTDTPFTFQLTYTQEAINNKVTIVKQAKFIANNCSTPNISGRWLRAADQLILTISQSDNSIRITGPSADQTVNHSGSAIWTDCAFVGTLARTDGSGCTTQFAMKISFISDSQIKIENIGQDNNCGFSTGFHEISDWVKIP